MSASPGASPGTCLLPTWLMEEAHPRGPEFSKTCTDFSHHISILQGKVPRTEAGRPPVGVQRLCAGFWWPGTPPDSEGHFDHWPGSLWDPPGLPWPRRCRSREGGAVAGVGLSCREPLYNRVTLA